MKTIRAEKYAEERWRAIGVVAAFMASVWLLNLIVNVLNFGYWAKQDGSGYPIDWSTVAFARLNPMIGWDHNRFSMAFPWLVLLLAAMMPFLLERMQLRAVVALVSGFFLAFWLLHDPASYSAAYVPYYIAVGIRVLLLLAFVIGVGSIVHKQLKEIRGLP